MANLTLNMDGDKMCIAFFRKKIKQYMLNTDVNPAGSGTITGAGTYNEGTSVTVEATPNEDYEFDHFEVNGEEVPEDDEEPPIPEDAILPQNFGSGDGTESNPWTGLEDAIDVCPNSGTVYLKSGYYQLINCPYITKPITIVGDGIGKTIIKTAATYGISIADTEYVTVKNMTIDGIAQTRDLRDMFCLKASNSDYVTLNNIEVINAGWTGMETFSLNHSLVQDIKSHGSCSHGIHSGTTILGRNLYNTYRNLECWDNKRSGFDEIGNQSYPAEILHNIFENIKSYNNINSGVSICYQKGAIISGLDTYGNNWGMNMRVLDDANMFDCIANNNGEYGVVLYSVTNTVLNNVTANGNNTNLYEFETSNITYTDCDFED